MEEIEIVQVPSAKCQGSRVKGQRSTVNGQAGIQVQVGVGADMEKMKTETEAKKQKLKEKQKEIQKENEKRLSVQGAIGKGWMSLGCWWGCKRAKSR